MNDMIMYMLYLIMGIGWIFLSINALVHIDERSQRKAWIDKYCSYESKRTFIKVMGWILLACGIILVLIPVVALIYYL